MFGISSSPLFSNFGLCLVDPTISHELNCTTIQETPENNKNNNKNNNNIPLPSRVCDELIKNCDEMNNRKLKKFNHNASERDRRKRTNSLYYSLRSLLPPSDQTKKLSIPATIERVLKYIPGLKKEVERLTKKKENYLTLRCIPNYKQTLTRGGIIHQSYSSSIISANKIGDREIMIQISILKNNYEGSIGDAISELEEEGLVLLNASTFDTLEDKVFYNLHFQVQKTLPINVQILRDKLLSYFEKEDKLLQPGIFGSLAIVQARNWEQEQIHCDIMHLLYK